MVDTPGLFLWYDFFRITKNKNTPGNDTLVMYFSAYDYNTVFVNDESFHHYSPKIKKIQFLFSIHRDP